MLFSPGSVGNRDKASPTFGHAMKIFLCYCRPYKESFSKEMNKMNNDHDFAWRDQIVRLVSLLVNWKAQAYC